jgi:hypothetical protein
MWSGRIWSDEVAMKVQGLFYGDAADAMRKAVHEG